MEQNQIHGKKFWKIRLCVILNVCLIFNCGITMSESMIFGLIAFGFFLILVFIVSMLLMPQNKHLEITGQGLLLYAYNRCDTYLWAKVKQVRIIETDDGPRLVLQILESDPEKFGYGAYSELQIDADEYGYDPDELYETIRQNMDAAGTADQAS